MKFKSLKTLALVSTAIVGIAVVPMCVNAATNADVTIDLTTDAGITAVNQADMDFGSWIIGVHTGDIPTITMAAATGILTADKKIGSDLVKLTTPAAPGVQGKILVTLPAGANGLTIQMTRGAITNFTDTGISLSSVTYVNADNAAQTGTLAATTPVPITITDGATGSVVSFGGVITATATPADNVAHTASFNVAFAF